eukprot:212105-Amphidinium_carterae.1
MTRPRTASRRLLTASSSYNLGSLPLLMLVALGYISEHLYASWVDNEVLSILFHFLPLLLKCLRIRAGSHAFWSLSVITNVSRFCEQ